MTNFRAVQTKGRERWLHTGRLCLWRMLLLLHDTQEAPSSSQGLDSERQDMGLLCLQSPPAHSDHLPLQGQATACGKATPCSWAPHNPTIYIWGKWATTLELGPW